MGFWSAGVKTETNTEEGLKRREKQRDIEIVT